MLIRIQGSSVWHSCLCVAWISLFVILIVSLCHSYFSYVIVVHLNLLSHVISIDYHKSTFILSEFCDFEMKFIYYIIVTINTM